MTNTVENIVETFIEIELNDQECFLIIILTLTRISISNSKHDKLTQTAHILQKRGKYYIVHFLELFALDGKPTNIVEDDKKRVIAICELLEAWGLLTIKTEIADEDKNIKPYMYGLSIIDFKSKQDWQLVSKYTIGNKK